MRFRMIVMLPVAGVLLAACETERQIVQAREDTLVAAGFSFQPANTPERQAELKTLPPHTFAYQERDGKIVYLYADPTVCNCLYIGSEEAYQRYHFLMLQKQIASEQLQAARLYMNSWNWGPWGPWGPGWW